MFCADVQACHEMLRVIEAAAAALAALPHQSSTDASGDVAMGGLGGDEDDSAPVSAAKLADIIVELLPLVAQRCTLVAVDRECASLQLSMQREPPQNVAPAVLITCKLSVRVVRLAQAHR